ncbi:thrombospondin type 3 repeat-containing protein, partial [Ochrovirga pacifica]|uniref:thrombospondin type 3 repeat-containing protein n=1 Tax=Ochrovirga pacifica TaxID=1042376 RepID=UPI000255A7CF
DQADLDNDGQGDVCDEDDDNDGINDDVDNCPTVANADQADLDNDGQGDACDEDDDNDGVNDDVDNCPTVANADQADLDNDGQGDACDNDSDNDGINDDVDNCPTVANPDQADKDNDGIGDVCDSTVDLESDPDCLNDEDCKATTFEHYLVIKGLDLDGEVNGSIVPHDTLASIKFLDISGKKIKDLEGIENFTALETLISNDNDLTVVDLTKNINLKHVSLKYNNLVGINVRDNIVLEELYLEGNELTEIDLAHSATLKQLELRYNKIKHLDVRNNPNLERLGVSYNELTELLLATNCNLTYLNASYNFLSEVELSRVECLLELFLNDNELAGNLDLSNHTKLQVINLCNNNLDNYPPGSCDTLPSEFDCFDSLESYMVYKGWDLDASVNGSISASPEVATMTYLNITNKCIQDMSGIELFVSLEELHMAGNNVATIDLSNNTLLSTINVSANKLTGLDVSNQVMLKELYAASNLLTSIDLVSNVLLEKLSLKGNQLQVLDLTVNEALKHIELQANELVRLELGEKMSLTHLYAGMNSLTTIDVSAALNLAVLSLEHNKLEGVLDLDRNKCILELNLSNNSLSQILFKNTINEKIADKRFNVLNNPNLTCIKVDDVSYSVLNWVTYVEDPSVFSEDDCNAEPELDDEEIEDIKDNNSLEIVDGKIVVDSDVVKLKIYKRSGRVVENENLQGLYFVMIIDENGKLKVHKILIP